MGKGLLSACQMKRSLFSPSEKDAQQRGRPDSSSLLSLSVLYHITVFVVARTFEEAQNVSDDVKHLRNMKEWLTRLYNMDNIIFILLQSNIFHF